MKPYYADDSVTLYHGHVADVLPTIEAGSVDCVVTSPPYYGLRDYGVSGQIGLEASPAEYVGTLRVVFAEVWRVLADDGVLWFNIGDSYVGPPRGPDGSSSGLTNGAQIRLPGRPTGFDRARKNLLGIPWRVAFALQDDGWTLRNAVIWHKPNAMPESVTDRLSTRYEQVFLFAKSRHYWFDLGPIREPVAESTVKRLAQRVEQQTGSLRANGGTRPGRPMKAKAPPGYTRPKNGGPEADKHSHGDGGRNPGDVWTIATQPFPGAHFATMPLELARRCILAGCKPGGTVLDPFSGSGTTGAAATSLGRRYVGIDLNAEYLDLSLRTRLAQSSLIDEGEPA